MIERGNPRFRHEMSGRSALEGGQMILAVIVIVIRAIHGEMARRRHGAKIGITTLRRIGECRLSTIRNDRTNGQPGHVGRVRGRSCGGSTRSAAGDSSLPWR